MENKQEKTHHITSPNIILARRFVVTVLDAENATVHGVYSAVEVTIVTLRYINVSK